MAAAQNKLDLQLVVDKVSNKVAVLYYYNAVITGNYTIGFTNGLYNEEKKINTQVISNKNMLTGSIEINKKKVDILNPLQFYIISNYGDTLVTESILINPKKNIRTTLLDYHKKENITLLPYLIADTNKDYLLLQNLFETQKLIAPYVTIEVKPKNKKQQNSQQFAFNLDSIAVVNNTIIDLAFCNTGSYIIITKLLDSTGFIDSSLVEFTCIRPKYGLRKFLNELENKPATTIVDLNQTFVAKYSNKEIIKNLNSLTPVIPYVKLTFLKSVIDSKNDTMQRRFFYNYWESKNAKKPEAAWKEYANNLNFVAKKYNGINSDRSRMYLRYGEPNQIEDVPNEPYTVPYEIWFYNNIAGVDNVVFLFIQGGSMGTDKKLLHTTLPTEKQTPNWQNILIIEENGNNRIFEFLPKTQ